MAVLSDYDAALVAHIASNRDAYTRQLADTGGTSLAWSKTWNQILAGNVGQLLEVIERLTRPAPAPAPEYVGKHREAGA